MEFAKFVVVGVNVGQSNLHSESRAIFANIVLMEQPEDALQPTLYELKHNASNLENQTQTSLLQLDRDSFLTIGCVSSLDKREKKIVLADLNTTVHYKHLITISKNKHTHYGEAQNEEFTMGLQALIQALRVQKKLPSPFRISQNVQDSLQKDFFQRFSQLANKSADPSLSALISKSSAESKINDGIRDDATLYHVQT